MPGCGVGDRVEIAGKWIDDPRWGRELKIESAAPAEPSGIESFLMMLPEIGPARAKTLRETYGDDIWDALKADPDSIREIIPGLTPSRMAALLAKYEELDAVRTVIIFLRDHGLGAHQTQLVIAHFAQTKKTARDCRTPSERLDELVPKLTENPYLLSVIKGIGFLSADRFALKLGISVNSPFRVEAALRHILQEIELARGDTACFGDLLMASMQGHERDKNGKIVPIRLNPPVSNSAIYSGLRSLRDAEELRIVGKYIQPREARDAEEAVGISVRERLKW